jgi:hypothetical protein
MVSVFGYGTPGSVEWISVVLISNPNRGVSDEIDPIFWHLMAYSIRRD